MLKVDIPRIFALTGVLWFAQFGSVSANESAASDSLPMNSCKIDSFQREGEMVPVADPTVELRGNFSVKVFCQGSGSGRLRLTLNPVNVYNGDARMQVVSTTGLLAGASNIPTRNTLTIPLSWQGDGYGIGLLRVGIVAPSGKLLRSATDYSLVVDAAFD